MSFSPTKTTLATATVSACLLAPMAATAADNKPATAERSAMPGATGDRMTYSDRARMKTWATEQEQLERELELGQSKAYYPQALSDRGFQITSVNDNEKDCVEYEVVKGGNSYEVQIDFEGDKAKDVDVSTNAWQTEATERALAASRR